MPVPKTGALTTWLRPIGAVPRTLRLFSGPRKPSKTTKPGQESRASSVWSRGHACAFTEPGLRHLDVVMAKASMFRCRAAWLMEVAGLSMALGAFVLGRLGEIPLMISATVPEAFNDNAASGVGFQSSAVARRRTTGRSGKRRRGGRRSRHPGPDSARQRIRGTERGRERR